MDDDVMGWGRRGGGRRGRRKRGDTQAGETAKTIPPPPPGIDGSVIQFRDGDTVSVQGGRGCSDYVEHTELTFAVFYRGYISL